MVLEVDVVCKAKPKEASLECTQAVNDSMCPKADEGQLAEIKLSQSWILQQLVRGQIT